MTIKITHFIPEEPGASQTDIFENVQQIHFMDDWLTLAYDEHDPKWKKFENNHGILFIEFDQELDEILIYE